MANNQAGDMYDPPGIGQNDFDEHRFKSICSLYIHVARCEIRNVSVGILENS